MGINKNYEYIIAIKPKIARLVVEIEVFLQLELLASQIQL